MEGRHKLMPFINLLKDILSSQPERTNTPLKCFQLFYSFLCILYPNKATPFISLYLISFQLLFPLALMIFFTLYHRQTSSLFASLKPINCAIPGTLSSSHLNSIKHTSYYYLIILHMSQNCHVMF